MKKHLLFILAALSVCLSSCDDPNAPQPLPWEHNQGTNSGTNSGGHVLQDFDVTILSSNKYDIYLFINNKLISVVSEGANLTVKASEIEKEREVLFRNKTVTVKADFYDFYNIDQETLLPRVVSTVTKSVEFRDDSNYIISFPTSNNMIIYTVK